MSISRPPLIALAIVTLAIAGLAQEPDPIGIQSKLRYHAVNAYGPRGLTQSAIWAGYLQETDSPREWGQGGAGYGKRLASALAYSGVRNTLGFGLDAALHQDPRYYRSGEGGFWTRTKHTIRGTILTHKDGGGETLATWRIGSAYGAAFISNQWRPDRVNTAGLSMAQGTTQLGFDLLNNMSSEFWPDVKRKMFHGAR